GDVGERENAVRVGEAGDGDARRVLAAYRQDDAALCQRLDVALPSHEGLSGRAMIGAKLDAIDSVVAQDAAPQRVVEVECEHLFGASSLRAPRAAEPRHVIGKEAGIERKPAREEKTLSRPLAQTQYFGKPIELDPLHAAPSGAHQCVVEHLDFAVRAGAPSAVG